MNKLLKKIVNDCSEYVSQGHVATYIPQLAVADPNKVGIYIATENGEDSYAGDCFEKFTMQSVVKPLILLLASAVIAWKHRENYVRMYNGTEIRFRKAGRGDYCVK